MSSKEIKIEERKCWYKPDKTWHCTQDQECIELVFANAKLLYCNDKECYLICMVKY